MTKGKNYEVEESFRTHNNIVC